MATEINCLKDLATISMTAVELAAVDKVIMRFIDDLSFRHDYQSLVQDISNSYQLVLDNLQPLVSFRSEQEFVEGFDQASQTFLNCYLKEISRPRINAELTYEKYLQFKKRKEVNTNYPLLKYQFARLHNFVDKWVDNDIWLAMTIDSLFKMTARLLNELSAAKQRDGEDAFVIYQSGLPCFQVYLDIIGRSLEQIAARV